MRFPLCHSGGARGLFLLGVALVQLSCGIAAEKIARPGIKDVQAPMAELKPSSTFELGGNPDWMVVTDNAVWISVACLKSVFRIDVVANKVAAKVEFTSAPCAGLAVGFGSLWVPLRLKGQEPTLARVDLQTNSVTATLAAGPADSEGGVTVTDDSVWIVTDKNGTLARIDPSTNTVRQKVAIPSGSFNPLFSGGLVWITRVEANVVTMINAKTGQIVGTVGVGPNPRFLTSGAGSIWTLNQGDGSVTRIDIKSRRVVGTIALGIPGPGGEICFGANSIWATMLDVPLTRIDTATNVVLRQWVGAGGDSVRVGHGSVWLTSLKQGLLWRIPLSKGLGTPTASRQ